MAFFKRLNEASKAFFQKEPTQKERETQHGEGFENVSDGASYIGIGLNAMRFNDYFSKRQYKDELGKINFYRKMEKMPEIGDVVEDAIDESTQRDSDDEILHLDIVDEKLSNNKNAVKNITKEFEELFTNRLKLNEILWDMFHTFLVDGRVYYERVINENRKQDGITKIKRLPSETMDFDYDVRTGEITWFYQYLTPDAKKPASLQEAEKLKNAIMFYPNQIGFIPYGLYGKSKKDIFGYLEKASRPFNQLRMLETSVVIYRLVRSPQRLAFYIDTGNTPRNKALKFVNKIKESMTKKQTFDPETGALSREPEVMCIRKNTEIPLLDGRCLTLEKIIEEHNEGKENWAYTINQKTLDIEPGKIVNAKITRKNEKLVRVWLDNDVYHDVTPDHKFILKDGTECRADMLQEKQSLMPLYRRKGKIRNNVPTLYEMTYVPSTHRWRCTHSLVSSYFNGYKKRDWVDHHCDFNRFNNNPSNLRRMSFREHTTMHGEISKKMWAENREKMVDAVRRGKITLYNDKDRVDRMKAKMKMDWKKNYDARKIAMLNSKKEWFSNEENRTRHSEWVIETNIKQNKVKKMHAVLNTPEIRAKQKNAARKFLKKRFSDPKNREKLGKMKSVLFDQKSINKLCYIFLENNRPTRDELLKLLSEDVSFMTHLKHINEDQSISNPQFNNTNKRILLREIKKLGFNDYKDFRTNYALNHSVMKIEMLDERDDTGCIEVENNHNFAISYNSKSTVFIKNSIQDNYFIPTTQEGRGSRIEEVGGNSAGFTELEDIYYFARKLYKALKYPMSRVSMMHEKREADTLFGGQTVAEITRDEVKWAKFLERQQNKFCESLLDTFLLHLEFKGLKKQYSLTDKSIKLWMTPPSNYDEQMEQNITEARFNNYGMVADRDDISRYVMQKKMLKWSEEEVKENAEGIEKDYDLGLRKRDIMYGEGQPLGGMEAEPEEEIEESEPKEKPKEEEE